jgi:hypothetical protein
MKVNELLNDVKANLYRATGWATSPFDMPGSPLRWQSWVGKETPKEEPLPPPSPADLLQGKSTVDWQQPQDQQARQSQHHGHSM